MTVTSHEPPTPEQRRLQLLRIALLDLSPAQVPVVPLQFQGTCSMSPDEDREFSPHGGLPEDLYIPWMASEHTPGEISIVVNWTTPRGLFQWRRWDPGVQGGRLLAVDIHAKEIRVIASPTQWVPCPPFVNLTFFGLTGETVNAVLERARRSGHSPEVQDALGWGEALTPAAPVVRAPASAGDRSPVLTDLLTEEWKGALPEEIPLPPPHTQSDRLQAAYDAIRRDARTPLYPDLAPLLGAGALSLQGDKP